LERFFYQKVSLIAEEGRGVVINYGGKEAITARLAVFSLPRAVFLVNKLIGGLFFATRMALCQLNVSHTKKEAQI
jgi:hypothetical protein